MSNETASHGLVKEKQQRTASERAAHSSAAQDARAIQGDAVVHSPGEVRPEMQLPWFHDEAQRHRRN